MSNYYQRHKEEIREYKKIYNQEVKDGVRVPIKRYIRKKKKWR